jgi:hypothetical protein
MSDVENNIIINSEEVPVPISVIARAIDQNNDNYNTTILTLLVIYTIFVSGISILAYVLILHELKK